MNKHDYVLVIDEDSEHYGKVGWVQTTENVMHPDIPFLVKFKDENLMSPFAENQLKLVGSAKGTTMEEAIAGMKRFGEILRESDPTLGKREDRPSEMKKFRTDGPKASARKIVHELFYKRDMTLAFEDVYVVWFASVLSGWKALVSTNLMDNCYYEVTHNGEKDETYVDRYIKEINVKIHADGRTDFTQVTDLGRIW